MADKLFAQQELVDVLLLENEKLREIINTTQKLLQTLTGEGPSSTVIKGREDHGT